LRFRSDSCPYLTQGFAARTQGGEKPPSLAPLGHERQMNAWHEKDGRPIMPFLDVTGGRALSFHGLSMGKPLAPSAPCGSRDGEWSFKSPQPEMDSRFLPPPGAEVIFGVGASHPANRRRDLLGLPPLPADFSAPLDTRCKSGCGSEETTSPGWTLEFLSAWKVQNSPVDKPLKRPAREPWNGRTGVIGRST
jgi:hypothetical protein